MEKIKRVVDEFNSSKNVSIVTKHTEIRNIVVNAFKVNAMYVSVDPSLNTDIDLEYNYNTEFINDMNMHQDGGGANIQC